MILKDSIYEEGIYTADNSFKSSDLELDGQQTNLVNLNKINVLQE